MRNRLVLLLSLLSLVRAQWWSQGATIGPRIDTALTGYSPVPINLPTHPQFEYLGSSSSNLVGEGSTLYTTLQYPGNVNAPYGVFTSNLTSGEEIANATAPGPFQTGIALTPYGYTYCSNHVILGFANGTVIEVKGTPCYQAPQVSYDGSRIYYGSLAQNGSFNALDSQTGAKLWSVPQPYFIFDSMVMPQDANGTLYLNPYYVGTQQQYTQYVAKINGATGDVLATSDLDGYATEYPPMMIDMDLETLYVVSNGTLFAYTLDFDLKWSINNTDFNPAEPNNGLCLALNQVSFANTVYWSSQQTLTATRVGDQGKIWGLKFPATINSFYVTGEGNINVVDALGDLYVISASGLVVWDMSIGYVGGNDAIAVPINGALFMFNSGYQTFGRFGYASVTHTSVPVLALGAVGAFDIYLTAYADLGNLNDKTTSSVMCLQYSATGVLLAEYNGEQITSLGPGGHTYILCSFNCSTPAAANTAGTSVVVSYSYDDGTVYNTPAHPQGFISLFSANPLTGPDTGGQVVTLTGSGFSHCGVNATCTFTQMSPFGVKPILGDITVISDTQATWTTPAYPCVGLCGWAMVISVESGSVTTQTNTIFYNWEATSILPAWIWGLIAAVVVAFGGAIVIFCLYQKGVFRKCCSGSKEEAPLLRNNQHSRA